MNNLVSTQKNFCAFSSASLCAVGLLCFRKVHRNAKKMQTCSSWQVNPTHFHKKFKVSWEQDTVLTSKSNTLRYKKENRKKFSAAAAIQKKKSPSRVPTHRTAVWSRTQILYKYLLPFSPLKKLIAPFWLSLQNIPHKPPNVHSNMFVHETPWGER